MNAETSHPNWAPVSSPDTSALTSNAFGRELFFRPLRHGSADLAPLQMNVRIVLRGLRRFVAFHNLSQSGVAVVWPGELELPSRDTVIDEVEVCADGQVVVAAPARVSSLQGDHIVGLELQGSIVAIDGLMAARDTRMFAAAPPSGGFFPDGAWVGVGEEVFKGRVAELALMIQDARGRCEAYEAELGWDRIHAPSDSLAHHAIVRFVADELTPKLVHQICAIDVARRDADPDHDDAMRAFARRLLHSDIVAAPIMRRALEKPLGYPGDYEVMRYMYERQFEGSTLLARALAHAFVHTPPARAVRARKDMIRAELQQLLRELAPTGRPVRLLSIAAGPAQEVFELLRDADDLPAPVDIVLFDQEVSALAFAYGRLRGLVEQRWQGRATVTYLHEGIKALIKNPDFFDGMGTFDGVICCGLYDYLPDRVAVSLTAKLFSVLGPGGRLWIGNMSGHNPGRWIMEHHLEWFLLYRSHAEMIDFASRGAPTARLELIEEVTTVNPFVRLTRA